MTDAPQKFDFIINRKSGSVLALGDQAEDEVERSLREIFKERAGNFLFVDGDEVAASVRDWVKLNSGGGRGLIIGGGDGTVMTAASMIKGTGLTLGFLPMGTQNFLATNLGFSRDWRRAAVQLLTATTRMMDVGSINGKYDFLVGGTFDDYTVKFFEAREDLRERNFLSFAANAYAFASGVMWGEKNTMMVGTSEDELEAQVGRLFAFTANEIVPRSSEGISLRPSNFTTIAGNAFGKGNEPDGQLVFYGSKGGLHRAAGIFGEILDGTWDKGKHVNIVKGTELVIANPDGAVGGKKRIVLDGELRDIDLPMRFTIAPSALRVYVPSL